jgi:hypothetical protein
MSAWLDDLLTPQLSSAPESQSGVENTVSTKARGDHVG